ncbi:MAG: ornithine carbamoyltransferase [Candidatus Saganbacteria bacterium]|nr:ornithine carbamoyltransferase [Candidatus Saganbacteria bacterium]
MVKLSGKDLISIHDLSASEIAEILALAKELKASPRKTLEGATLAMIFEKPSARTRVSFEVGMWQLGGKTINLAPEDIQLGKRETIGDVAKTLSRYIDGIMIRTFAHEKLIEFAKYATVPVINGLSDLSHPCQALADVFTIQEKKGGQGKQGGQGGQGLKVAYIGDGNNVCHSLMFACAKVGIDLTIATPVGYEPKDKVVKLAFEDAKASNIEIDILNDPVVAVEGADVIYTDVWTSMGQETETEKRKKDFRGFQVNSGLVKFAKKDVIVMHCLPAHRGMEITDEVIDGPNSVVFDQAENRLHVQKAILTLLLGS